MTAPLKNSLVSIQTSKKEIVGAGFLVAEDLIVTCAHVIKDALELDPMPDSAPKSEILLDFPFLTPGKLFKGRVVYWEPKKTDGTGDIAGLQLDKDLLLTSRPIQLIRTEPEKFKGHAFSVFGFPKGQDQGAWAYGVLKDERVGTVQLEDIKLAGKPIEGGFSGSPVWDNELERVIGMITTSDIKVHTTKVAYMIPVTKIAGAWEALVIEPDHEVEKPLSSQEDKNRQGLLQKVYNYWIRGVLEKSILSEIRIDLGLEERLDAIDFVRETLEQSRQSLPREVKAINKFDELGIGRTLLILGKPGSGKTTTLLEIARELIDRAEREVKLPIPVVLSLSAWTHEKWKFADWLIHELETGIYKVPETSSKTWIQNQQLLLLLDGLDEVREELRESCVETINQFSQEYGLTEIIVCCREKVYETFSQRLRFQSALLIEPLKSDQIKDYLDQAGKGLSGVKLTLQTDPVLHKLAQTPLMLSVMALAYQGMPASTFSQMTLAERRSHLWKKYIDRAFERKQGDNDYPKSKALNWLSFLAQRMIQESQTLFLIEQIKPGWLKPGIERRIYPILVGLMAGLMIEWVYGLPLGLIAGLLSFQMLAGLLCGIALGVIGSLSSDVKLFTAMGWSWSWEKAWKAAIPGLLSGPLIAFLIWLFGRPLGLVSGSFWIYLILGLITGLLIALVSVIFAGLVASKLDNVSETAIDSLTSTNTNQGFWQSVHRTILTAIITLTVIILPIAILIEPFIPLSVILGCISLYAGGMACIQHITIRAILWQGGNSPWNYTRFLNNSTQRLILQKTGGSYQFVHDFLREEIAAKYTRERYNEVFKPKFSNTKLSLIGLTIIAFLLVSIVVPITINTSKVSAVTALVSTPRLEQGDRLLVDRMGHRFFPLKRGDLVLYEPTSEMKQSGFGYLLDFKQILGLPGEEIEIIKGKVYIDGQSFQNSNFIVHPDFQDYGPQKVPPHMYLVVVNNPHYRDEKNKFAIILISKDQIVSRVLFRFWPFQKMGLIPW